MKRQDLFMASRLIRPQTNVYSRTQFENDSITWLVKFSLAQGITHFSGSWPVMQKKISTSRNVLVSADLLTSTAMSRNSYKNC